jgi:hypothetical protein
MTRSGTTDESTKSSIVVTSEIATVFNSSPMIRCTSPATAPGGPAVRNANRFAKRRR